MGSGNPSGLDIGAPFTIAPVVLNVLSCTEVSSGASASQVKLEVVALVPVAVLLRAEVDSAVVVPLPVVLPPVLEPVVLSPVLDPVELESSVEEPVELESSSPVLLPPPLLLPPDPVPPLVSLPPLSSPLVSQPVPSLSESKL
jgi:hypothetical protein